MSLEKILVVEDDPETRTMIKRALAVENYRVVEAGDGKKGLQLALEENPDLMILDLMLPGMSGIEVCNAIRQEEIRLPIIMLTGKKEPVHRVKGLSSGADDYVEKPFNVEELLQRVKIQLRHVSEAQHLAEKLLQKKWKEINEGLQLIATTHHPFFHSPDVPGIRTAVHYMPFGKIGGDFYRIAKFSEDKIGMLIGDAIGKGLPAAFLMASTFANLYRLMRKMSSPAKIFTECNQIIRKDFKELGNFVAAFLAFYHPREKKLVYTSAGHQPPILIKKNKLQHQVLRSEGYFLGAFDDGQYQQVEIKVDPGDLAFFYTDGLLDIRDKGGNKVKFPHLYREILKNKHLDVKTLSNLMIDKCKKITGDATEIRDDLTFFFIEF